MNKNTIIAVYSTHSTAEEAVKELDKSGFNMKQLSIVGRDYHTDEHVVGYYNMGERAMAWGKTGAFWGGLWGVLLGSAFFWVPGIGPLMVAGPFINAIVGGIEGVTLVGALSAIGGALASLPSRHAAFYHRHCDHANAITLMSRPRCHHPNVIAPMSFIAPMEGNAAALPSRRTPRNTRNLNLFRRTNTIHRQPPRTEAQQRFPPDSFASACRRQFSRLKVSHKRSLGPASP